jgi:hypothetical protein
MHYAISLSSSFLCDFNLMALYCEITRLMQQSLQPPLRSQAQEKDEQQLNGFGHKLRLMPELRKGSASEPVALTSLPQ